MKTKKLFLLAGGLAVVFLILGVFLFPQNSLSYCTDCFYRDVWSDYCNYGGECNQTIHYTEGVACCDIGFYPMDTCPFHINLTPVVIYSLTGLCEDWVQQSCRSYQGQCNNPIWDADYFWDCHINPNIDPSNNILRSYRCGK
ncbi:MAG: hypothetical protein AB1656_00730 [Candidatus Omnitrophota bacterium]